MSNRRDIDTVAIVEIGNVERRRLDKEKILSFSHVQAGQTIIIYGDQTNPDSMIINSDAVEFQNLLNGVLPHSELQNLLSKPLPADLDLDERLNRKASILKTFKEESSAFKQEVQDSYWFMPDSQGNYKNIAADEIYEVSPNPNSPWMQTPN